MIQISTTLPEQLKAWVDAQVSAGLYVSAEEYVNDLIRSDWRKQTEFEALMLEGLHSGTVEADEAFWASLRADIETDIAENAKPS